MEYRIEYQSPKGLGNTKIEAKNEALARVTFYEIYSRLIKIIDIQALHSQAA